MNFLIKGLLLLPISSSFWNDKSFCSGGLQIFNMPPVPIICIGFSAWKHLQNRNLYSALELCWMRVIVKGPSYLPPFASLFLFSILPLSMQSLQQFGRAEMTLCPLNGIKSFWHDEKRSVRLTSHLESKRRATHQGFYSGTRILEIQVNLSQYSTINFTCLMKSNEENIVVATFNNSELFS